MISLQRWSETFVFVLCNSLYCNRTIVLIFSGLLMNCCGTIEIGIGLLKFPESQSECIVLKIRLANEQILNSQHSTENQKKHITPFNSPQAILSNIFKQVVNLVAITFQSIRWTKLNIHFFSIHFQRHHRTMKISFVHLEKWIHRWNGSSISWNKQEKKRGRWIDSNYQLVRKYLLQA